MVLGPNGRESFFFQRVQPDLRKSGIGNYHKGSAIFSNLKIYYKL